MDKAITAVLGIVFVGVILLLGCVAGTAFGALTGAVVNFFFPNTVVAVLSALGITLPLWQVGAGLGFVGMFVRSSVTQNNS